MTAIAGIAREVFGLFVENGWSALSILVWIAISAMLVTVAGPKISAPVFAIGLMGTLVVDVLRSARR